MARMTWSPPVDRDPNRCEQPVRHRSCANSKVHGRARHVRYLVSASDLHQCARLDSREAVQHVRDQRLERLEMCCYAQSGR